MGWEEEGRRGRGRGEEDEEEGRKKRGGEGGIGGGGEEGWEAMGTIKRNREKNSILPTMDASLYHPYH